MFFAYSQYWKISSKKCIIEKDRIFIKQINDKYFGIRSLTDIIDDYNNDPRTTKGFDNDGKAFYKVIISNLEKVGITEQEFITYLCDDICSYEDISKFVAGIEKLLR